MTTITEDFDFVYLESLDEIKDLHNILNRIDNRFSDFFSTFMESIEQRAWEELSDEDDDTCGSVDRHFEEYFPLFIYFCNDKKERTSFKDATDYYWESDDDTEHKGFMEPCDLCKKYIEKNCTQEWFNPKTTNCFGKIYSIWKEK